MANEFKYDIQYASHDFNETDQKGYVNLDKFLLVFNEFPWKQQIEMAKEIKKVSPTISVKNISNNYILWVSAYDDEKSQKTREIIHELGKLGCKLGSDIKLDQINCCYFLLLGQSICVDIFSKENKKNEGEK